MQLLIQVLHFQVIFLIQQRDTKMKDVQFVCDRDSQELFVAMMIVFIIQLCNKN